MRLFGSRSRGGEQKNEQCLRPPAGWYCSRGANHEGPCAARPLAHDVDLGQFPHCDQSVLHAPGECEYCDRHPDWQAIREAWGIAFTGHEPSASQVPCPSDQRRGLAGAHVWYGNVPRPSGE